MQTSFYYDKQHGFIRSMENVILSTDVTIGCVMSGTQVKWQMVKPCEKHVACLVSDTCSATLFQCVWH